MLEFEVVEIDKYCPMYSEGDKLVIDNPRVIVGKDEPLCNVALSSVMEYAKDLERGVTPKELGLARPNDGDCAYIQCGEKCRFYSEGGCVTFKGRKVRSKPMKDITA